QQTATATNDETTVNNGQQTAKKNRQQTTIQHRRRHNNKQANNKNSYKSEAKPTADVGSVGGKTRRSQTPDTLYVVADGGGEEINAKPAERQQHE
ncbi:unnamed protein product, partial [Ceratitis capitata]